ncbi:tRNA uridine-5-carboxymethylaminomethyl(34) synthesis GTPase MnmE [Owenweeksia hongkongensis]|uniref:tRNA uridine-5-carboxymethylaminomethyl(34) synthesis GTPase MnmE n=1 Tax=Owenweeksia hongkongensis TaxID=253245 RepID=UPI003A921D3C
MRMDDTICALSTPQGMGAIAMIRISGSDTFPILEKTFKAFSPRHNPSEAKPYSLVFGKMVDGETIVDEVMVGIFKGPHSYTGEDVAEISCHGSVYIQEQIIRLLLKNGCRIADPGEYTMRAFTAGKMDLSQAEAVADLIESESKAAHQVAMQQMRGGFSEEIKGLRTELINFASLIELELDFGEEDVEFADRTQLSELLLRIKSVISRLLESFDTGNVIKNGVPVAIVGAPNAGKSTLLNALLNEEKAIVTDVAGTTRDAIEDEISLGGVRFRFIDTAGIRETEDLVESIGIKKTFEKIEQSRIVMYLFNAQPFDSAQGDNFEKQELIRTEIAQLKEKTKGKTLLVLANKMDLIEDTTLLEKLGDVENLIPISALQKRGLKELETRLTSEIDLGALNSNQTIVTNARHFSALQQSLEDILRVEQGMENNISGDFLAMDIREALKHLGSIIGEVETDRDILGNIFGKFCIGK